MCRQSCEQVPGAYVADHVVVFLVVVEAVPLPEPLSAELASVRSLLLVHPGGVDGPLVTHHFGLAAELLEAHGALEKMRGHP